MPPNLMDGLFAAPDGAWRPVSRRLAHERRALLALFAVLATVAVVVIHALLDAPSVVLVSTLGALLVVAGWLWWVIGRGAASWGYAEREEDLYIRHGVLFRRLVTVPYGRMQYVDVQAGPLDQLFRIATVHLHTASPGTSARIPGLPADEAARLRDRLTSLGHAQAAGL